MGRVRGGGLGGAVAGGAGNLAATSEGYFASAGAAADLLAADSEMDVGRCK